MIIFGKHVDTEEFVTLTLDNDTITSLEPGKKTDDYDFGGDDVWISPAFIDVQVNGVGGISYRDKNLTVEQVVETTAWLYQTGTGHWCPTITTCAADEAIDSLRILAQARQESERASQSFVGFHVEGPYIASEDGPRGAHPLEHTRDPNWDEFCRYQEAANGQIAMLTLAPERKGALAFIEKVAATGVIVSIGHTGASRSRIQEAIAAGATMSTHLGNGAHAMLPRHDNYLWEQLVADKLWAGIIPDGHHLPDPVLQAVYRLKQQHRLCLVSDAAAIAGLPPGIYQDTYGTEVVEIHPNGKIALAGTPYLAGAARFLDLGIANMVAKTDASLTGAIKMATHNPARLLNLSGLGKITVGGKAHITLFRWQPGDAVLSIITTILGGNAVYRSKH